MLIFKSTFIAAFILLILTGFNSSFDVMGEDNLPEDYSEYEQELQFLEKMQEKDEEKLAQTQILTDSVSDKAAAPVKLEEQKIESEPEIESTVETEKPITPATNPSSHRRIRSR